MAGWGISENATKKEKFWADINDTLKGNNSVGNIDYTTYSTMYDELRKVFDQHMEEFKEKCKHKNYIQDELDESATCLDCKEKIGKRI